MESKFKDLYFVAVKVFLRDADKLLIVKDVFGAWDLPGGRIKKDEFDTPLEAVIERKIKEELGPDLRFELVGPNNVFFRVERAEVGLDGQMVRIFAIGYDAQYTGGEVTLGKFMEKFEWVDVASYNPVGQFEGGWLKGIQDYLAIKKLD